MQPVKVPEVISSVFIHIAVCNTLNPCRLSKGRVIEYFLAQLFLSSTIKNRYVNKSHGATRIGYVIQFLQ
jgi:hypothetical protein